jgi:hypothetical protein
MSIAEGFQLCYSCLKGYSVHQGAAGSPKGDLVQLFQKAHKGKAPPAAAVEVTVPPTSPRIPRTSNGGGTISIPVAALPSLPLASPTPANPPLMAKMPGPALDLPLLRPSNFAAPTTSKPPEVFLLLFSGALVLLVLPYDCVL